MKTLAFLLFLMNIGFYAWLQGWLSLLPWQPHEYKSQPQAMQLSMDVESLTLVSERDAPPLKTIAPEKMRLADSSGVLTDKKPRTLQDEAKVVVEATHEESLKAAKAKLILAENTQNGHTPEPENSAPSIIVPSNLRTMSVISKIAQLPKMEEAEQIEDDHKSNDVKASDINTDMNLKPNSKESTESIKELLTENTAKIEDIKHNQIFKETPETIVVMADTSEPEKNTTPEYSKPVQQTEKTKITYKQPEANSSQKTSEQQADDFFSRLAQTVQKVGNTFKRVSNDVFNERVTVPPELAVEPEVIKKVPPKPVDEIKPLKVAAAPKPDKPSVKSTKPVKQICYEIGSYTSIKQLNKHANWLKSKSKQIKTFIDKKTINEVDKVRVYIAPNSRISSVQQGLIAQNIVVRLRHEGVSDMRLMTSGALKNSISLGVYDSYANAQRRANAIKAKGYANVHLKNYYKQQKKYWLIAKMPQTQQIIASKFRKTFKQTRLDAMQHCK
ncbi:hypothetical protein [Candidatus Albibeggiatoa sp. nov. BB20]|uniref:hypothetical protein n=1 Tax=Candidatus Albibeggiatoa sp. nov. BB20 TaxID=3162723 RepID=UPI00336543D5